MPKSDRYRKYEVLQADFHGEQSHYWSRFVAFATLHAGLIVLVASDAAQKRPANLIIPVLGLALGILWLFVQWLSRNYVDRWKPAYHKERKKLLFFFPYERPADQLKASSPNTQFWKRLKLFLSSCGVASPLKASTDIARLVPVLVVLGWIALLYQAFYTPIYSPNKATTALNNLTVKFEDLLSNSAIYQQLKEENALVKRSLEETSQHLTTVVEDNARLKRTLEETSQHLTAAAEENARLKRSLEETSQHLKARGEPRPSTEHSHR